MCLLIAANKKVDILKQLEYLTKVAKRKGYAVAIGHPYPTTVKLLSNYLPTLAEQNIEVVPVTTLLKLQVANQQWPTLSARDLPEKLH